eukprot:3641238-Rhodomonas_salina.2
MFSRETHEVSVVEERESLDGERGRDDVLLLFVSRVPHSKRCVAATSAYHAMHKMFEPKAASARELRVKTVLTQITVRVRAKSVVRA